MAGEVPGVPSCVGGAGELNFKLSRLHFRQNPPLMQPLHQHARLVVVYQSPGYCRGKWVRQTTQVEAQKWT